MTGFADGGSDGRFLVILCLTGRSEGENIVLDGEGAQLIPFDEAVERMLADEWGRDHVGRLSETEQAVWRAHVRPYFRTLLLAALGEGE